jgi:hypothetical protein|tara:strand:- start:310 stop:612 length:303 start_codon:yes stop_codon:yes gene_type:complete
MAKMKHTKQEKELMKEMVEYGCVVCRKHYHIYTPPNIHHFRKGMGMGQRSRLFIPLCWNHHQHPKHGIHGGTKSWIAKYGTEQELLDYYYATVKDYLNEL